MSVILWKIIIASILLLETMGVAFLGWRVLELMKRVKLLQVDRNELIEERNKLRLRELETLGEFSDLERKMILNALNMSQYKNAIEGPKETHVIRIAYRNLREKIKESLE